MADQNPATSNAGPDVIVDFIFEDGLFFISVENIGDRPAYKVTVQFEPPIRGLGGAKKMSEMALFRNIEFLAPHKQIRAFLDVSAAYFARGDPTQITARIAYQDASGARHADTIRHDLVIYRDIGYVKRSPGGTDPQTQQGEE